MEKMKAKKEESDLHLNHNIICSIHGKNIK